MEFVEIRNALREKADRLDRFFGVMDDWGEKPRGDRTLLLEAADMLQRYHDALDQVYMVALQERCVHGTPWDLACVSVGSKLNVYIDAVLSRGASPKDALQQANASAGTERRA